MPSMTRKTKDVITIYAFALIYIVAMGIFTWSLSDVGTPVPATENAADTTIICDRYALRPITQTIAYNQLPEFPSGSEFFAAASLLTAYGYPVDAASLLDYMNYSDDDFVTSYTGNPREEDGYCLAPALTVCVNNFLASLGGHIGHAQNLTGLSWTDFYSKVEHGQPLAVWITSTYGMPLFYGKAHFDGCKKYENEQVVVACGANEDGIQIADSLHPEKIQTIPTSDFRQIWEACGAQCMGILEE